MDPARKKVLIKSPAWLVVGDGPKTESVNQNIFGEWTFPLIESCGGLIKMASKKLSGNTGAQNSRAVKTVAEIPIALCEIVAKCEAAMKRLLTSQCAVSDDAAHAFVTSQLEIIHRIAESSARVIGTDGLIGIELDEGKRSALQAILHQKELQEVS